MSSLCPRCGAFLSGGPCVRCRRAGRVSTRPAGPRQSGAARRGPSRSGRGSRLTGQVVGARETVTGRASGTTALIVLGLATPLLLGLLIDQAGITAAVHGVLAAILTPIIVLLLLSLLLGRTGRFARRAARTGISVGAGIGRMTTPRRGGTGPGCALLVRHPQGETRVLVALDLDIPLGRTVTVRGPIIGGHLQAWRVQVVGVDDRAFLCRGVAAAVAALSVGGLCCLIELVGAIAR